MKEDERFITYIIEKVKITTNIKRINTIMVMGLTIFGIVLAFFGFLGIRVFDVVIFKKQNPKISLQKEPETKVSSKEPEPQVPPQPIKVGKLPLSKLIEILKELSSLSYRLNFIKDNIDFMPEVLSLKKLNDILDLFSNCSDKLTVTKIFLSRLENNYPDSEFERFKDHYALNNYKVEAINLLLRNKK